jgi:hypothetical protein
MLVRLVLVVPGTATQIFVGSYFGRKNFRTLTL